MIQKFLYKQVFAYFPLIFIRPNKIIHLYEALRAEDSKNFVCIHSKKPKQKKRISFLSALPCTIYLTIFQFSTNAIRYDRFLHTLTRKYFYARLLPFTSDIRIQTSYSITTSIIKSPSP